MHVAHGDGVVGRESVGLRVGALLPSGVGLVLAETQARRAGGNEHSEGALTCFVAGAVSVLAIVAVQIVDPVLLTPDDEPDAAMPLEVPLWRRRF